MPNNPHITIDRGKPQEAAFDYDRLRQEAIARVQQLSGAIWTDYNLHDPGVTILEQCCYAITDLAYRTNFPIEEILADKNGNIDPFLHAFFSKAVILSTAPVTVNDYRKLVLDEVEGVENIWIEPVITPKASGCTKGVYRAFLQVEDELADNMDSNQDAVRQVKEAVSNCLLSHRNIGEMVEEIIVLEPQEIFIRAEILADSRLDAQEIMAHILNAIEWALHPPVRFFSETELADKGYAVEEIYNGPLLQKGFVIDSDLQPRKGQVDPTELVKAISQVAGVMKVRELYIAGSDGEFTGKPLQLEKDHYPLLKIRDARNDVRILSDKYEYRLRDAAFWSAYQKLKVVGRKQFVGQRAADLQTPLKAAYRNLSRYYSMQHNFPAIYGIGQDGLDADAHEKRKAQARQLKAYLLFFEQLMANYLAQLGSIGNFFSPLASGHQPSTYAVQSLHPVPHVQPLLADGYTQALYDELEPDKVYQARKNRVLDHLLARFNLVLAPYPVTLYAHLYEEQQHDRISAELKWKAGVLHHIAAMTGSRMKSFNYREDIFDPGKLSGFETLLYRMLHIPLERRRRLTAVFDAPAVTAAVSRRSAEHLQLWMIKEYRVKEEVLRVQVPENPDTPGGERRYDFGRQPVSLLRHGLDAAGYRIVFDEESREYLVVYRHAHQEVWRVVIRERSREQAAAALKDMIQHLRDISKNSEGFYLVEHLLLKPGYRERAFGFRLMGRNGQVLLEQANWCSFEEREQLLRQLQEQAAGLQELPPVEAYRQLQRSFRLYLHTDHTTGILAASQFADPATRERAGNAITELLLYIAQLQAQDRYYPALKYYVRHPQGGMLREEFFRFGLTVVLPAWPARFQVQEFREFTEQLFKDRCPVQFRIQFKWLGITDMRRFEEDYFSWLQALRQEEYGYPAAAPLISYLAAEQMEV